MTPPPIEPAEPLLRKFQKELSAGTVSLALLGVLAAAPEPMYGYQIAKRLEQVGDGVLAGKQSALYPVLRNLEGSGTVICGTRYGNVMASRGSVIPLFVEQVLSGKPITVTDPAMTRFMMTLDDAVELVLYAFSHGRNGDIFVQKAPAATVADLATAILGLMKRPAHEVREIGTRHGEKLYEVLCSREEMARAGLEPATPRFSPECSTN